MNKSTQLVSIAALAALSSCTGASSGDVITMLVGTYTYDASHGIYSFAFDQENGTFAPLDSAKIDNPSYLCISGDAKHVYSVTESGENSSISAFDFDAASGRLSLINTVPSDADPCHITLLPGNRLSVANYSGGTVGIYRIDDDGSVADDFCSIAYDAPLGPDTIRQKGPHIHFSLPSPDGQMLFVNDLGTDRIHRVNIGGDSITAEPDVVLTPGYGPRHSTFSPNGKMLYLLGELSGNISAFSYEQSSHSLSLVQDIHADEANGRGSADIVVSPDGKFLYASHRLINDGISIFAINQANGTISKAGYFKTGIHPRNFVITPNGKYLLVACRDSNSIEVLLRDAATGALTPSGKAISVPRPVCIKFAPKQ